MWCAAHATFVQHSSVSTVYSVLTTEYCSGTVAGTVPQIDQFCHTHSHRTQSQDTVTGHSHRTHILLSWQSWERDTGILKPHSALSFTRESIYSHFCSPSATSGFKNARVRARRSPDCDSRLSAFSLTQVSGLWSPRSPMRECAYDGRRYDYVAVHRICGLSFRCIWVDPMRAPRPGFYVEQPDACPVQIPLVGVVDTCRSTWSERPKSSVCVRAVQASRHRWRNYL